MESLMLYVFVLLHLFLRLYLYISSIKCVTRCNRDAWPYTWKSMEWSKKNKRIYMNRAKKKMLCKPIYITLLWHIKIKRNKFRRQKKTAYTQNSCSVYVCMKKCCNLKLGFTSIYETPVSRTLSILFVCVYICIKFITLILFFSVSLLNGQRNKQKKNQQQKNY